MTVEARVWNTTFGPAQLKDEYMAAAQAAEDAVRHRKALGAVYTPGWLADWLVREVSERFGFFPDTVLDPAAGEGALLTAAHRRWPSADLIALDINPSALETVPSFVNQKIVADAVLSAWPKRKTGTRLVLANPPWGATMTRAYRKRLEPRFETARGQYDSYDLFLERIAKELGPGDVAAAFLPDSLLLHQHKATRDLVAENCTIHGIYRLGEGAFPGVFMSSMAIIFSKGSPPANHEVKYAQLRSVDRAAAINGAPLYPKISDVIQRVPQGDLVNSSHGSWAFDAEHNNVAKAVRNISGPDAWKVWFKPGRGLEIGKNGDLLVCPRCKHPRPIPRSVSAPVSCTNCHAPLSISENRLDLVRSKTRPKGSQWVPLAVGHDLHRHELSPTRWIRAGVEGIDYKDELLADRPPRLLVRKTGLGIHAAVEWEPGATTQTIYHFSPIDSAPNFAVPYAAGMLSSRVLTAWHMSRSGDVEWRSHPYLTLSSIQSLPLPHVKAGTERYEIAQKIAQNVTQSKRPSFAASPADLETEYLVAEILGHGPALVDWALETLAKASGSSHLANLVKTFRPQHEDQDLEAGN